MHLSLLEPTFASNSGSGWAFPTETPSLADITLYYQLRWGVDIAAGRGIYNLTGGGTGDTNTDVTASVWNEKRYPGLWRWFHKFERYIDGLPDLESVVPVGEEGWKGDLRKAALWKVDEMLVSTPAVPHTSLDRDRGLVPGVMVSIAPDDTGRDNPTVGRLVRIGVEEVVIEPHEDGEMKVRVHFPRLGFVVKVLDGERARL